MFVDGFILKRSHTRCVNDVHRKKWVKNTIFVNYLLGLWEQKERLETNFSGVVFFVLQVVVVVLLTDVHFGIVVIMNKKENAQYTEIKKGQDKKVSKSGRLGRGSGG